MLHRFKHSIAGIEIPSQFTWPFHYTPHQLCFMAAEEVKEYIATRNEWHDELKSGKMFGVLVVADIDGTLGFVSAFSGNLAESNNHDYFVPPIYDALQPGDFFKKGEAYISQINHRITHLSESDEFRQAQNSLNTIVQETSRSLDIFKKEIAQRKALRQQRRENGEEEASLIAESQYDNAEFQRRKKHFNLLISQAQAKVDLITAEIDTLKDERKTRSAKLQMELFSQYRLLNAKRETKDICDIFAETVNQLPPAGTGECAAPKMLQYAYQNNLHPIAMAEFWWGNSPKGEIRSHGHFYPSCISKCKPILLYMMQGLDVEPNPLNNNTAFSPTLLWEDGTIVIINKPSGMLSVDGKIESYSVEQWAKDRYPHATGPMIVHRLDQSTSGILVIAKDKETHQALQAQFLSRKVKKSYVALLDGPISDSKGEINLPLKLDYDNRPRQMVAPDGKKARTRYEVIGIENGKTRVRLYPITGRTHQLRVHCAHPDGLNTPIVGDELYGTPAHRLCLHAEHIEFTHPTLNKTISINCAPEF